MYVSVSVSAESSSPGLGSAVAVVDQHEGEQHPRRGEDAERAVARVGAQRRQRAAGHERLDERARDQEARQREEEVDRGGQRVEHELSSDPNAAPAGACRPRRRDIRSRTARPAAMCTAMMASTARPRSGIAVATWRRRGFVAATGAGTAAGRAELRLRAGGAAGGACPAASRGPTGSAAASRAAPRSATTARPPTKVPSSTSGSSTSTCAPGAGLCRTARTARPSAPGATGRRRTSAARPICTAGLCIQRHGRPIRRSRMISPRSPSRPRCRRSELVSAGELVARERDQDQHARERQRRGDRPQPARARARLTSPGERGGHGHARHEEEQQHRRRARRRGRLRNERAHRERHRCHRERSRPTPRASARPRPAACRIAGPPAPPRAAPARRRSCPRAPSMSGR